MNRDHWATRRLRARFDILVSRSMMPLRSPRKSRSEVPGQSCRALPGPETVKIWSTAIMSQSPPLRAALPCPTPSFLTLVEKQNSYNRMTLKFVEYLYFSALECGFA